jgi:hypothetical protein
MLLSGQCEVLGLEEGGSEPQFVARELEESEESAIIVDRPESEAIEEAMRRNPNGGNERERARLLLATSRGLVRHPGSADPPLAG